MKKIVKVLSALSLAATSIIALAACGGNNDTTTPAGSDSTPTTGGNDTPTTSGSESLPTTSGDSTSGSAPTTSGSTTSSSGSTTIPADYVPYTVKVQAISGKPIDGAYVALVGLKGRYEGFTDNGVATIYAPQGTYEVVCEDMENEGYVVDDSSEGLQTDGSEEIVIKYVPQLINEEMPEGTTYTEYDQMYDYTFEGYDFGSKVNFGEPVTWKLSELLEDNELVVLNFWYTTCSWCVREFPYLVDSYSAYTDKVKVIGINPGSQYNDTVETVTAFAKEQNLNIMSTVNDNTLVSAFGVSGFPTSVFIDRYGTVTMVEGGAITTKDKWDGLFKKYTGDDYKPTYESSGSDIVPDVDFPGSSALEEAALGTGVSATFREDERNADLNIWPWVPTEDGSAIHPTNKGINSSYSVVWMEITVPANKVLALDYKASCEDGDILGIFLDGKRLCQMAGNDKDYKTQYLYVAGDTDEKISIEFFFMKDKKTSMYDDTVYIKNIRFLEQDDLTTKFQVIRQASTGSVDPVTNLWTNYVTVVFNDNDGYYHVGTVNGPLLLVGLNDENTHFSNKSIVTMLYENAESFIDKSGADPIDYGPILSQYANYGDNSSITMLDLPTNGLTPITKELYAALQFVAREFGVGDSTDSDYENQWLEMCVYISEYNTPKGEEIGDPIKGLATFSAFDAAVNYFDGDSDEPYKNYIKFDFPLVPRGYLFKFTPKKSGVYHVYGVTGTDTECFFYTDEGVRSEDPQAYVSREYFINADTGAKYATDFTQYMYYEAGKTYYVAPAFFDIDDTEHTLEFKIDYVGENMQYLAQVSDGAFTYEGTVDNIISISNIDVVYSDVDLKYHPADDNGNPIMNKYIYADFKYTTGVFSSQTLEQIIENDGFDFSKDENGNAVTGTDETETAKSYLAKIETDKTLPTYGTVEVDYGLMSLLQKLMDKYTFVNVSHETDGTTTTTGVKDAWHKLCYFMVDLGSK